MEEPIGPFSEVVARDLTKDPTFSEPEGSLPKRRIRKMALSNSEKGVADFINIVPGELFAQGEILRWEDEKDDHASLLVLCPVVGPILSWDADVIFGEKPIINVRTSCCSYAIASFAPHFEQIYHELCDSATLKWSLWRSAEAAEMDENLNTKKLAITTVLEIKGLRNGFGRGLRTADDMKKVLLDQPQRLLLTVLPSLNSHKALELAQSIVERLCKAGFLNGQVDGATQVTKPPTPPSPQSPLNHGDGLAQWKKAAEELEAKLRKAERQLSEREEKERELTEKIEAMLSEAERHLKERELREREVVQKLEARAFRLQHALREVRRLEGEKGELEEVPPMRQLEGERRELEEGAGTSSIWRFLTGKNAKRRRVEVQNAERRRAASCGSEDRQSTGMGKPYQMSDGGSSSNS